MRRRLLHAFRYYGRTLRLPPRVARFYVRARRRAARAGDEFSLGGALPPRSLRHLLAAAGGARDVVEIGTGTGWGAIALALAVPERGVISYDPLARPERERYLALAGEARGRIELREAPGEAGPRPGDAAPELVFVDGSHERGAHAGHVRGVVVGALARWGHGLPRLWKRGLPRSNGSDKGAGPGRRGLRGPLCLAQAARLNCRGPS